VKLALAVFISSPQATINVGGRVTSAARVWFGVKMFFMNFFNDLITN